MISHFYWDDVPGSDLLTSEEAGEQARAFACAERDKARQANQATASRNVSWRSDPT